MLILVYLFICLAGDGFIILWEAKRRKMNVHEAKKLNFTVTWDGSSEMFRFQGTVHKRLKQKYNITMEIPNWDSLLLISHVCFIGLS